MWPELGIFPGTGVQKVGCESQFVARIKLRTLVAQHFHGIVPVNQVLAATDFHLYFHPFPGRKKEAVRLIIL
jgi:hypothetical protein